MKRSGGGRGWVPGCGDSLLSCLLSRPFYNTSIFRPSRLHPEGLRILKVGGTMLHKRELPVPSSHLTHARQGFSQPCSAESRIRRSRGTLEACNLRANARGRGITPNRNYKKLACKWDADARTSKSISSFFNAATAGSLCGFAGTLSAISRYASSSLPLEYEKPSPY